VYLLPPLQEQAVIGHLLGEGMFEDVFQLRKQLSFVDELQALKIEERSLQVFVHSGYRRKDTIGKFPAYDRGDLHDSLEIIFDPVHTGRDDSLNRVWHLDLGRLPR